MYHRDNCFFFFNGSLRDLIPYWINMTLYKPNCATNVSACYEPVPLTYEDANISFSGRRGCWPRVPALVGRDPGFAEGLLCRPLRLPCHGCDCHFQNEFSLSHLIPPKQVVSPHGFCDDWFLNQKNKRNEKNDQKLSCPLPQATQEMPGIFLHWKLTTWDHLIRFCTK